MRWLASGRWVYWVPQCGTTTTTSTVRFSARMSAVIRARARRSSGPVRGGMFSRLVPARRLVADGDSPIESVASRPMRTPSRVRTTGFRASARLRPAPT